MTDVTSKLLTRAEFDALASKDPAVLYIVKDSDTLLTPYQGAVKLTADQITESVQNALLAAAQAAQAAAALSASAAAQSATNAAAVIPTVTAIQAAVAGKVTEAAAAKVAAQDARDAAQTAQGLAEDAQEAAEAAQAAAETAKAGAVSAKNDAVTAKTAAETARAGAETAETGAVAAKNTATTKANEAAASALSASGSATSAANSVTLAQNAATAAVAAKDTAQQIATAASQYAVQASASADNAAASATTAGTKASEASSSASSASSSASSASSSATSATASATSASTSASTATTKANEAAAAATGAASSRDTAASSATLAGQSATAASTAKDTAQSIAQSSQQYATAAAASATAAAQSAASATSSEQSATASKTAAAASASAASASETAASGYAATATTKATEATTAATTATAKASEAATSATASALSATEAEASAEECRAISLLCPPACTDMGISRGQESLEASWGDPESLVQNGWTLSETQRVLLVGKRNGYPSGPDDGTIYAATSRNPSTDTYPLPAGVTYKYLNYYRQNPIAIAVPEADTVYLKLFACSRNGGWNDLSANEFPSYTDYSWSQLANYADAGTFFSHVALGSTIDAGHADFPNMKWLVNGDDMYYRTDLASRKTVGLVMWRVPFTTLYDASESQYETTVDTAAVSGITYAVNVSGTITALVEGTDWNPGDTTCVKGGVEYPIAVWLEKNPNANYNYGSNFTPNANLVRWADSDGVANSWYTRATLWDRCTSTLATKNGFMRGLPQAFKECLVDIQRINWVYSSFRKRGIGTTVSFSAKCFVPTLWEINGSANQDVQEGKKRADLFSSNASRIAYLEDGTTATSWWSASAYSNYAYNVYCVTSTGTTTSGHADSTHGARLACAIGRQEN